MVASEGGRGKSIVFSTTGEFGLLELYGKTAYEILLQSKACSREILSRSRSRVGRFRVCAEGGAGSWIRSYGGVRFGEIPDKASKEQVPGKFQQWFQEGSFRRFEGGLGERKVVDKLAYRKELPNGFYPRTYCPCCWGYRLSVLCLIDLNSVTRETAQRPESPLKDLSAVYSTSLEILQPEGTLKVLEDE